MYLFKTINAPRNNNNNNNSVGSTVCSLGARARPVLNPFSARRIRETTHNYGFREFERVRYYDVRIR